MEQQNVVQCLQNAVNDFLVKVGVIKEPTDWDKAIAALSDAGDWVDGLKKRKPAIFINGATVIVGGKKTRAFVELAQEHQNANGHYKPGDFLDTSEVVNHSTWFVETKNTVYVLTNTPGAAAGKIEVLNVYEDKAP
uniref:Uncharacterized protein n=1 Tax=Serratia phage Kevin TaxID=3161161 RepID=A0AAU8KXH6_9CAUD